MSMRPIAAGKDKGWCRCERCGCLLLPDSVRYAAHLERCDGSGRDTHVVEEVPRVAEEVPLALYADLVADLPFPTQQQRDNFIDYVSHARSWYKAISPYPPGIPVHFFLDEYAGCDRNGTPIVTPHATRGVRTDVYRTAFGYLNYSTGSTNNVRFLVPLSRGIAWPPTRVGPHFLQPGDRVAGTATHHTLVYGLPEEIFDSGEAWLTGAVHTLSAANPWVWDEDRRRDQIDWPQESGGRDTLEAIFSRCRYLREPSAEREYMDCEWRPYKGYPSSERYRGRAEDRVLYELLGPERRRQQKEMLAAIDRVCVIIESQRSPRTLA